MIKTKQGNCIELLKELESNSIDLLVTEPPYKTINVELSYEWIPECYRVLKDSSHAYIMTNSLEMSDAIEKSGFEIISISEYFKCNKTLFNKKNKQYVIFCRKGKAKELNLPNIEYTSRINNFSSKVHPTEKPVGLMQFYIENSSKENDIVLDPFMGSGSTGVACLKSNRNFIGFEIDGNYYKIATDRIITKLSYKNYLENFDESSFNKKWLKCTNTHDGFFNDEKYEPFTEDEFKDLIQTNTEFKTQWELTLPNN